MNTEFPAAYKQLNAAQKEAVDTIDGPLLVVAGPGTGKTQLLSLRVANILKQTDTDPGNILCLTFTNYAATNMRDRLTRLVGPDARNVTVRTFHSFAAEIMGLYPDYFWNGAHLSVAPDAVQIELIQNVLSVLSLDNPLASRFAGNLTMLTDVQQALRLTKEAGLTPDKLRAMIEVNQAYIDVIEPDMIDALSKTLNFKRLGDLQAAIEALPDQPINKTVTPLTSLSTVIKESLATAIAQDETTGKTTQTGKWKRRWLQTVAGQKGMFDERRRNAWWIALSTVYEAYRQTLHTRGYYDYSDMIVEVISQLEQQPELLASVQERYLYVLIDEFQDTNAAQLRLAHLVATHSNDEGHPNLMAVGDDDQSIFAFNGAELSNMLSFRRTYETPKIIVLEQNYRSTQAVLDMSEAIITQAENRLVTQESSLSKHLEAAAKLAPGKLEHTAYPTREHQLSAMAQRIQQSWQADPKQSIAVLARSHDSLKRLSVILHSLQVPIRYERQNNILEHEAVEQLYLLAETVQAIADGDQTTVNHNLSVLLRHPMWQVNPATLWQLAVDNYRLADWLTSLAESGEPELVTIGAWLQWLAQATSHESLPIMLEHLIGLRAGTHRTSPIREYYLSLRSIDTTYLETLSAIQLLQQLSNEFTSADPSLEDFIRFIQLNRQLGRSITNETWYVSGDQAIELMTVHKAKGLEFDTVFLLDAVEDSWKPRTVGRRPPANLPLQSYGEHYDDYIRLLYVAATRAKQSFIVSSYYTDEQGREILPTPLLQAALPATRLESERLQDPIQVLELALQWPRLELQDEQALLNPRLENFRLSATALLQFLDLSTGGPQAFLERQLLRLPEISTANMAYGTAMHAALQSAQQQINAKHFTRENLLQAYRQSLTKQNMSSTERERYEVHGEQMLANLFDTYHFALPEGGQAEVSFGDIALSEAVIGGKLDHIYAANDELLISDYKTGKALSSFTTRDQTKVAKAWRQQNQLVFYALLARQSSRFKAVQHIKTRIVYVEAESEQELVLEYTPTQDDLDHMTRLVEAVWRHVLELNFPDTSAYSQDMQGTTTFIDDLLSGTI